MKVFFGHLVTPIVQSPSPIWVYREPLLIGYLAHMILDKKSQHVWTSRMMGLVPKSCDLASDLICITLSITDYAPTVVALSEILSVKMFGVSARRILWTPQEVIDRHTCHTCHTCHLPFDESKFAIRDRDGCSVKAKKEA